MSAPEVQLSPLPRADGSAAFSHNGFKVLASVNGPIEAPKKDEAAFEAVIDVIIRPASGVGGTRERHQESLLRAALATLIPVKNFPQCSIQIVLQVTETPTNDYVNAKIVQGQSDPSALPPLLHAAILSLMTAAIPLNCLAAACTIAISPETSELIVEPTAVQISRARSVHVLGFTSTDELLITESQGAFSASELQQVLARAKEVCCKPVTDEQGLDTAMEDVGGKEVTNMKQFMRSAMVAKVQGDLHWKTSA
ncbi:hypothetical protein TD95_002838 [Thielaviopsis punctulata]|uniref:Exoribonuclease phosphorolytic domain-containing protein n=1 Tax=Thielaviopsis punctulata TaxID=72032 RepID=A0A0F4ZF27_9PEZI|nr:hypothetical protein TD95_002838 [Thielaviopsis punctulata]